MQDKSFYEAKVARDAELNATIAEGMALIDEIIALFAEEDKK